MAAAGWGGYQNGEIPLSSMVQAEPGDYLEPNAAAAWAALAAACFAETGRRIGIEEAYRDLAGQNYYWNRYVNRLPGWTIAARPGTSNHGRGVAVDMTGYDPVWSWLQANAGRFGWSWATGKASGERWHWEFVGALAAAGSGGGSGAVSLNDKLGGDYVGKLQAQLGVDVDRDAGPITTKALQRRIGTPDDGDFGPASTRALQTFVGAGVDGDWGAETTAKTKAAIDDGKFGTVVSAPAGGSGFGALGGDYTVRLQRQLNVPADGDVGPVTSKALQTRIGAEPDGVFGIESTKKLQAFIGAAVDGEWGNETTTKMRAAIDGNRFANTVPTPVPPTPPTGLPSGYAFGLDVAYPQTATFDWPAVKAAHDFVIIKAGGAEDPTPAGQPDSSLQRIYGPARLTDQHLVGARSVGLRVGFYWFNNGLVSVKAQADRFAEVLRTRIRPGDVIALDVEGDGADCPQFTPAQALEFVNYMHLALGIKTLIYVNRSTMKSPGWKQVADAGHPLWLAVLDQTLASGLAAMSSVVNWPEATIVQYASTLGAPGYGGMSIDRNFGKVLALQAIGFVAFPSTQPEPAPQPDLVEARKLAARIAADSAALVAALEPTGN